ncbi:hypothetical protein [Sphingobacterium sp. 2149]|uniref:hypothetical protein n=1 Tax=Sphingobacterium sp. 2149 TaxID=2817763 RepID=UPI00285E9B2D|nr:hypothetical protein [Sphingobacterium sp. 2149]MDR6733831.1 hypothetical protein [Sphingobacterium sp. 2149]
MDNNKTIVIYNSVRYFLPFFNSKGIRTYMIYKDTGFVSRAFRKLFGYFGLNRTHWYGEWYKELKKENISRVILFANDEQDLWSCIRKSGASVIFWYWNPTKIYSKGTPNNLPENFKPYSFDPVDCKVFNMKFNTTLYFDNIILPNRSKKYDVLFVGMDKGRKSQLEDLEALFKKMGISSLIYIVGNRNLLGDHSGNKPIEYNDYLGHIAESSVILDLLQERQSGLTLRAMESLFFSKKLITNDHTIVEQPFYNEHNIFIIGKDSLDNLKTFIQTPFVPVDTEIVRYYDVTEWLKRFK